MTLREWELDPEMWTMMIGSNHQAAAHWTCLYGNCHRTLRACARCYRSTHGIYGHTCLKTYTSDHRREAMLWRWNWYLYDRVDLHMSGTTLQLHETALRRIARRHDWYRG